MNVPSPSYDPLVPVAPAQRVFGARDAFALWFSLGIGLLVLQAGALLTPALSLGTALAAILAGSVLGVVLLALVGVIGADTGLASMAMLRPTLGVRGAVLPTCINVIQLVGWGSFEIIIMSQAADALMRATLDVSMPMAWTVVFGLLATLIAVLGPVSFVRRFLRAWGLWLILAAAGWLTFRLLAQHDFSALFARPAEGGLGFGGAVDLVVAMPLSWLPLICDYSRFGKSPSGVFRGTAVGYFIANVWFYGLGAAYGLATGEEMSLVTALATAGSGLALLLILLDETDNAFADIHSAAVSTGTLFGRVPALALGFGALCTFIALTVPLAQYEGFLLLIGSVFAPLFGVVLADHFLVRRRRIEADHIARRHGVYWFAAGWNLPALLAWVCGVAVFHGVTAWAPDVGATLPALVLAGAIHAGVAIARK
ncbi:putative hydroxymethylpyrimidine transporter CytX [Aquabacter sp. L1I39]|uniref:putative hydroxymethylpyrimidine transporter CytX n=1 Tax=Aquabacter sp. L1I39 TaxID=2820278 RepID=UPI001ADC966C|nr:putative hydroxymethylpyrimidine transporter CytX [Aquabacter sp. L1I39]QTL03057.1 putative hydroxymethylpyrimidine transporter CytX [Aquabacter sp. L1I39]